MNRPKAPQLLEAMSKEELMDYIEKLWNWLDEFEAEIIEIQNLAENQIKHLMERLKCHRKPKRGTATHEYERIECLINCWQHTRLLCLEILGENQNES